MVEKISLALNKLKEGNQRFRSGDGQLTLQDQSKKIGKIQKQNPFAVILGCSDSRVPVEIIFDQGLGDLFVIRVAGNIATPSQIGSVEFAIAKFEVPLVVVLGHSDCGAIQTTIEFLQQSPKKLSPHLNIIVNQIYPTVKSLMNSTSPPSEKKLVEYAVRSNIRSSMNLLTHESHLMKTMIQKGKLKILGAEYSILTGKVSFLDNLEKF